MEIAIVGADAERLREAAAVHAFAFASLAALPTRSWRLLALAPDALGVIPRGLCADSVLLPGDSDPAAASALCAGQIIGYGFSPRDTLTLSSFASAERLLCLQRSLLSLDGTLLEPQELPLPPALAALPEEYALLAAGVRLLCSKNGQSI